MRLQSRQYFMQICWSHNDSKFCTHPRSAVTVSLSKKVQSKLTYFIMLEIFFFLFAPFFRRSLWLLLQCLNATEILLAINIQFWVESFLNHCQTSGICKTFFFTPAFLLKPNIIYVLMSFSFVLFPISPPLITAFLHIVPFRQLNRMHLRDSGSCQSIHCKYLLLKITLRARFDVASFRNKSSSLFNFFHILKIFLGETFTANFFDFRERKKKRRRRYRIFMFSNNFNHASYGALRWSICNITRRTSKV